MLRFYKAHGLGNDYLVLVGSESLPPLTGSALALLCSRNFGLGGDGILVEVAARGGDFGLRIFNPDGSEAEKSGNGVRIFARYLHDSGRWRESCDIDTVGGRVRVWEHEARDGREFTVDMGVPSFSGPAGGPGSSGLVDLPIQGTLFRGTPVSLGNPHWVMFVDDVSAVQLDRWGPLLECHPMFPGRTNVQFAQVLRPQTVRVRIWERGAGVTLASGSSACAVVAAGMRLGFLSGEVQVEMDGGSLLVYRAASGSILQRGPVCAIAEGEVAPDLQKQVETLCLAGPRP